MQFEHEFYIPLPIDQAWAVLTNIELIAPCMPGAQLEEAHGDSYKGSVKIRVGPITTQYRGTAVIVERDAAARRMVLDGKGADSYGQGNAAATAVGLLYDEGERTRVTMTTDLQISGKVAQLGQGVMKDVSAKLLKQFVANLEKKLASEGPPPVAAPTSASIPASIPVSNPVDVPMTQTAASAQAAAPAPLTASVDPEPVSPAITAVAASAGATAADPIGAPITPAPAAEIPAGPRKIDAPEAEAIDILQVGGSAVLRRYGLVIAALAIIAVLAILLF